MHLRGEAERPALPRWAQRKVRVLRPACPARGLPHRQGPEQGHPVAARLSQGLRGQAAHLQLRDDARAGGAPGGPPRAGADSGPPPGARAARPERGGVCRSGGGGLGRAAGLSQARLALSGQEAVDGLQEAEDGRPQSGRQEILRRPGPGAAASYGGAGCCGERLRPPSAGERRAGQLRGGLVQARLLGRLRQVPLAAAPPAAASGHKARGKAGHHREGLQALPARRDRAAMG